MAADMIKAPEFAQSADTREKFLKTLRTAIKNGQMSAGMMRALTEVQQRFPEGTSIRCRSSTNNEDLTGFSGAGLYDSFTHRPDEGPLAATIKQVFASLWNYRAFEEREFYRIDHFAAAMAVVLHPNTVGERANGVAVTKDILYQSQDQNKGVCYYVNAQVGEDLVTNPGADSVPDELLIGPRNPRGDRVIQSSNRTEGGAPVLDDAQLMELRRALRTIHARFAELYGVVGHADFAMEVEFKIKADGHLLIKQARPWVD